MRLMVSVCEVIRCGNMYLVPGQVTEAPAMVTFLSLHDSNSDGMTSCITMPGHPLELWTPWTWIFAQRGPEIWFSLFKFRNPRPPSTDCILLASRRDIHDTVTRIDERKLEKLLAFLFDNGHVFPSFQVSLLSHVARDYREICTRYDTLESYFRKLEI